MDRVCVRPKATWTSGGIEISSGRLDDMGRMITRLEEEEGKKT
jgi:hypothetical protein